MPNHETAAAKKMTADQRQSGRSLTTGIAVVAALVCAAWLGIARPQGRHTDSAESGSGGPEPSVAAPIGCDLDSQQGEQTDRLPPVKPLLRQAAGQWQDGDRRRPEAVQQRLERVVQAVNGALGTGYVAVLGHSGFGGSAEGGGMVTVDFDLFWRLGEDAAAALVAHEFAHELLGHRARLKQLRGSGHASQRDVRTRRMELEADEWAGRAIGATEYQPSGFSELLSHLRNTLREDPLHRHYVPHQGRLAAFQRGYQQTLASREARQSPMATTRPSVGDGGPEDEAVLEEQRQ